MVVQVQIQKKEEATFPSEKAAPPSTPPSTLHLILSPAVPVPLELEASIRFYGHFQPRTSLFFPRQPSRSGLPHQRLRPTLSTGTFFHGNRSTERPTYDWPQGARAFHASFITRPMSNVQCLGLPEACRYVL